MRIVRFITRRCAIVSTASVPTTLPMRIDATLGALVLKEIKPPTKTVFSRQKQPVVLPSSFWKLIAVHACTTLEGMSGTLNPAVAIAIRHVTARVALMFIYYCVVLTQTRAKVLEDC